MEENKKNQSIETKTLYILTVSFLALFLAVLTVLLVLRKPVVAPDSGTTASSSQQTEQQEGTEDVITPDTGSGEEQPEEPDTPEAPDTPDIPEVEIPALPGENQTQGDNALPPVLPPDWAD